MSYTRPPFDAADASWSGAILYVRKAYSASNASFETSDLPIEMVGLVVTTPPPNPPVTISGFLAPPAFDATGTTQTSPPIPALVSVSGALHEFIPYIDPGLDLTLSCGLYIPRPLSCQTWLDAWQTPCQVVTLALGYLITTPPTITPSVSGIMRLVQPVSGQVSVTVQIPVTAMGSLEQSLDLPTDMRSQVQSTHRNRRTNTAHRLVDSIAQMHTTRARTQSAQQQATPAHIGTTLAHTQMDRLHFARMLDHQHAIRATGWAGIPHTESMLTRAMGLFDHAESIRIDSGAATPHAEQIRTHSRRWISQTQAVTAPPIRLSSRAIQALATRTRQYTPQQQMMWPLPGRWWPWYEPPSLDLVLYCDIGYVARPLSCLVVLCSDVQPYCPGVDPKPQITIPIREVYIVINSVSLTRLDGTEIPADGLSLSLDAESWAWSWSARVPGSARSLLVIDGEPQELIATINGEPIRLRIDSISRAREFGSSWLSVQGRGRAAILAGPTAASVSRHNGETLTAQQLLNAALTDNGVSIGWTLDWQIEDWSVPAGAWSHTGTYIEAATRIAEAGGGYIQGHDTDTILRVLPYYPAKPWEWATIPPDIIMPEDICRTEGIEWVEKANYNAVWVTSGVRRDYIRRAGTDGLTMAPTIVDALATEATATRQRGTRVLADTGKQALITVKLPVIDETGIIRPGNLIQYTEQGITRRGLSRAVSIDAGFPEVWQTIKIEARE